MLTVIDDILSSSRSIGVQPRVLELGSTCMNLSMPHITSLKRANPSLECWGIDLRAPKHPADYDGVNFIKAPLLSDRADRFFDGLSFDLIFASQVLISDLVDGYMVACRSYEEGIAHLPSPNDMTNWALTALNEGGSLLVYNGSRFSVHRTLFDLLPQPLMDRPVDRLYKVGDVPYLVYDS